MHEPTVRTPKHSAFSVKRYALSVAGVRKIPCLPASPPAPFLRTNPALHDDPRRLYFLSRRARGPLDHLRRVSARRTKRAFRNFLFPPARSFRAGFLTP